MGVENAFKSFPQNQPHDESWDEMKKKLESLTEGERREMGRKFREGLSEEERKNIKAGSPKEWDEMKKKLENLTEEERREMMETGKKMKIE